MQTFDTVIAAVESAGLVSRGAFHVAADDAVPPFADGAPAKTLVLVGNAGPGMWAAFSASAEAADGAPDALDRWSRRVVSRLADTLGGAARFPFGGPPWLPFIRWAQRAGTRAPLAHRAAGAPGLRPVARLPGRDRVPRTARLAAPRRPRQPLRDLRGPPVSLFVSGRRVLHGWLRRGRVRCTHFRSRRRVMPRGRVPRPPRVSGRPGCRVLRAAGRVPHAGVSRRETARGERSVRSGTRSGD